MVKSQQARYNTQPASHLGKRHVLNKFLRDLVKTLDDPQFDSIIYWSESGDTFFLTDQTLFAEQVLLQQFGMCNFRSFYRQLNIYSIKRVCLRACSKAEFVNENLKRGRSDLLLKMSRNDIERNRNRTPKPPVDIFAY